MPRIKSPSDLVKSNPRETDADLDMEQRRLKLSRAKFGHLVGKVIIFSLSLFTLAVIVVFLWHLLVPSCWRWLTTTELAEIRALAVSIIGGLIMSGAMSYFFTKIDH